MPGTADLALILVILILLASGVVWLVHLGKRSQAEKDTQVRLKAEREARDKEAVISDAAKKIREEPGPTIPDI